MSWALFIPTGVIAVFSLWLGRTYVEARRREHATVLRIRKLEALLDKHKATKRRCKP